MDIHQADLSKDTINILTEIRAARDSGVEYFAKPHDFPFGVSSLDLKTRRESEVRQFKHLHQNCFMLAAEVLTACQLRLLLLLDGYLNLVENRSGLPLFGITRSIMDLNGLLLLLQSRLGRFRDGEKSDWRSRGEGFFSYLVRARYGTRDPSLLKELLAGGFSKASLEPIHSRDCEEALFSSDLFANDRAVYGKFNDLIHTNNQGYNFGSPGWYESDRISFGMTTFLFPEPVPVVRYSYPALEKQIDAIGLTADPTLRHTQSILGLIRNFPISPFEENEVLEKTGVKDVGRAIQFPHVSFTKYDLTSKGTGRNDFCPCGSGKKFKHCCLN